MDITMGLSERTEFKVTDNTANIHSIEVNDEKATFTILVRKEELQELSTAILDKLSLEQKMAVINYLSEQIGGLWDWENTECKMDDLEYDKEVDKVFCKWKEGK